VSLPEEHAYIVHMDIPHVEDDEIREVIMAQLEEFVPLKADNVVFDYTRLDKEGSEGSLSVLVAAMPKDVIDVYIDVLESAGITPLSFEIESQAMARAIVPREKARTTCMIVDIGGTHTGVSVVEGGVVSFTSTIDMGSEAFTNAIVSKLGLSEKEAEEKKNTCTVGGGDVVFTDAIYEPLERLSEGVEKLCAYWGSYHLGKKEHPISEIFLCGGGANLSGLAPYLGRRVGRKVSVANPWVNVCDFNKYVPPIPRNKALGYATAIGLAIPEHLSEHPFLTQ
jgi:type IV pilus assembly protein PilM